jgi:hypothetical protein
MLVKFAYDPALTPVSGFVRQAGDDDALGHLRPSPDRFDELSMHSRVQAACIRRASNRRPLRFKQVAVHPAVSAFADIADHIIHE